MSSIDFRIPILPVEMIGINSLKLASVAVVILAFVSRIFLGRAKQGKALPTPGGLPWAGPVWQVDGANIYNSFKTWADKHGTLFEVKLFGQNLIIISDPKIAQEILAKRAKIASDRPALALVKGSRDNGKYLPFMGTNEHHIKHRKFGVMINNYAHQNNYFGRMLPEATRFAHQLLEGSDTPFSLIDQLCGRLSCRMAFGTPAPRAAISRSAHNFMQNLSPGGRISNVLQFLKYLPASISTDVHNEAMRVDVEDRVWHGSFAKAKQAYADGILKDSYAKYYFDRQDKFGMTEQEALHGIAMMATVSILTIIAPIQRWLVVMAENPNWQTAVQKELDDVLQGRMADIFDAPLLPTLRATILESIRYASPVPTGIPHVLEEDIEYNGFHLGKGSNVMACDWNMCRSNEYYQDAHKFDPSRYLDPASACYKEPLTEFPKIQGHSVFGWGRRVCVGMDYAATQLLVVCAAVAHGFNVSPAIDSKTGLPMKYDFEKGTPNVLPIMEDVPMNLTPRSGQQASKIRVAYKLQRHQDTEAEEEECF